MTNEELAQQVEALSIEVADLRQALDDAREFMEAQVRLNMALVERIKLIDPRGSDDWPSLGAGNN